MQTTDIVARSQRAMKEVFLALEVVDRNMDLNINQSKIKYMAAEKGMEKEYGTNNYCGKP